MLQREQVVARLDSRSAVADDVLGRDAIDVRGKSRAQIFRRAQRAPFVDIPLKKIARGARNVSGNRIHRFDLAAIALRRPRVEQAPVPVACVRRHVVYADRHLRARRQRMELGPRVVARLRCG